MKRLIIISAVLAFVFAPAMAQNNPYGVDDQCYEYFRMAESLINDLSNDAFNYANEALLKRATEVGDEKARTLHYVEKLKRECRVARLMENREEANARVEALRTQTVSVALETGYTQYLYYAYSLSETYYVNTRQEVHAQAQLQDMLEIATQRGDEYGLWESHVYLAKLYQHQNDYFNTRKHLRIALSIFDSSEDESIRRQSVSRMCCDLSDTYETGTDSSRLYIRKAEDFAKLHYDSLRVNYYKAQLAAFDRKVAEYRRYRDYCLNDHEFADHIKYGDLLLSTADALLEGAPRDTVIAHAKKVNGRPQMLFIRSLAIACQREDIATWMGSRIIVTFYSDISNLNDMKMEEMSASINQHHFKMELERQKSIKRMLLIALCVVGAALLAALAALFKKKNNKQHK